MSRRTWSRIVRLEVALADRLPIPPVPVLMPGQALPEGYHGPALRVHVKDCSLPRPATPPME